MERRTWRRVYPRLVRITLEPAGSGLRLRRLLCGKAQPSSLPGGGCIGPSLGKAQPFRTAGRRSRSLDGRRLLIRTAVGLPSHFLSGFKG